MPEISEVRLMSDFINHHSKDRIWKKIYHVQKGNIPIIEDSIENFTITSISNGKQLLIYLNDKIPIDIFMSMSGNWSFIDTKDFGKIKYCRLRFDSEDGKTLLLHGGYLGPKYKFGSYFNSKRGPDMVLQFDLFKNNIMNNLTKKDFQSPIYELLLNQKYFNGLGNYLRSEILFRLDINPFQKGIDVISDKLLNLCRDVSIEAYNIGGGQFKDWVNPFKEDSETFIDWLKCYTKGNKIKDKNNRTFWYDPKWEDYKNNI